jgi:hypothetical protein
VFFPIRLDVTYAVDTVATLLSMTSELKGLVQKSPIDTTGQDRGFSAPFQHIFRSFLVKYNFFKNKIRPLFTKPYSSQMSYLRRSAEGHNFFPRRAPYTRKWILNSSCDFEKSFLVYFFSSSYPLIANFFALFIAKGHPIRRNSAITETQSHIKVTLCQLTPKTH